jgi:hypothetical protein
VLVAGVEPRPADYEFGGSLTVTEHRYERKIDRYYIKDPALRFWFRYIFRNQSLIEIGDEKGLTAKILNDLPTLMGRSFEELVRALLTVLFVRFFYILGKFCLFIHKITPAFYISPILPSNSLSPLSILSSLVPW